MTWIRWPKTAETRRTMPSDGAQDSEEYRGFAIAPYGDEWEATYENLIRRVFPTKRKAKRWIDRRVDHGLNRRGIARRFLDKLIGYEPPDGRRRFPDSRG